MQGELIAQLEQSTSKAKEAQAELKRRTVQLGELQGKVAEFEQAVAAIRVRVGVGGQG